jgi:hypothetical protein
MVTLKKYKIMLCSCQKYMAHMSRKKTLMKTIPLLFLQHLPNIHEYGYISCQFSFLYIIFIRRTQELNA